MSNNNNDNANDAWAGKSIRITGVGGAITIENDKVVTARGRGSIFHVERVSNGVRFRYGNSRYLTIVMYGDACRQASCEALVKANHLLLPENIRLIVEYTTPLATNEDNFEGSGYCYQPMTIEDDSPPNALNTFTLQNCRDDFGRPVVGVQTQFESYWRSEHWNKVVSQSPHCLGDEQWTFQQVRGGR